MMNNQKIKAILPLFAALLTIYCLQGQQTMEQTLQQLGTDNFTEVQDAMNQYFLEHQDPSGEKKWRRQEWLLEPRFYPSGEVVNITQKSVQAYESYIRTHPKPPPTEGDRAPHGSWVYLGPNSWTTGSGGGGGQGRVNSIDIHPTNSNIIYLGTSNGGIWKTTNGGSSWTNTSPHLPLLAIADLEINYNNPAILYALTGDGDPSPGPGSEHSQAEIRSIGILKSTNSGSTWFPTGFTFPNDNSSPVIPTKLIMHPTNPNIQFVASANGIYKTTNGWSTHDRVFTSLIYDIEFKPGSPSTMYASASNKIYKSTDTGENWSQSTDPDLDVASGAGRIELAVTPNYSNCVYAMAGDWDNGSIAFFRSLNSAINDTWSIRDETTDVIGAFAPYCIGLYADPANYTLVFGGGVGIWKSTNGGYTGSWSQINQGVVHADVHDILYQDDVLYVACDGGFFKSTDDGSTWTDLSPGIGNVEIYRIAGTPQNSNLYYMGTQDNGTYKRPNYTTNFIHVVGADGMTSMIDPTNVNNVYATIQYGTLYHSTNGGTSWTDLAPPGGNGSWISPVIMDATNTSRIFLGKSNCYRSLSSGASGTFESIGSPWFGKLNCLAQGVSVPNRLYASADGQLYKSDNALAAIASDVSWTSISADIPNQFITGIEVDPTHSGHVFVSLSGYSDGNKVFMTTDYGTNWTNLSGSLPNIPVNCIAFHNNGSGNDPLYIGTDIGVFYRDNSIGDWIYFSDFLPNVIVTDLYINHTYNTITAGTFGRGLWRSSLKSVCNDNVSFSSSVVHGGTLYYAYNQTITSQAIVSSSIGTEVFYQAGNYIDLKEGFQAPPTSTFEAKTGPCPN